MNVIDVGSWNGVTADAQQETCPCRLRARRRRADGDLLRRRRVARRPGAGLTDSDWHASAPEEQDMDFRRVAMTDSRTRTMIEQHQLWVATTGKSGRQLVSEDLDFRGAQLPEIALVDAEIPGADFSTASMARTDLSGCNLASAKCRAADFSNAAFAKSNLDYADFTAATLIGVNLRRASLIEAVLTQASLEHADLRGANLSGADLRGASLAYSRFDRAFLDGTKLGGANLRGATGIEALSTCRIDIGVSDAPELQEGEAAKKWLFHAAKA